MTTSTRLARAQGETAALSMANSWLLKVGALKTLQPHTALAHNVPLGMGGKGTYNNSWVSCRSLYQRLGVKQWGGVPLLPISKCREAWALRVKSFSFQVA